MSRIAELVRVHRNGFAEGGHSGSLVVTRPDGSVRLAHGAADAAVLPRSCAKPFQAVAMLAAGAPLTGADLALAAGSHTGEPVHVDRVRRMLDRIGCSPAQLSCPDAWPADPTALRTAMRAGESGPLFMECSGKHAGMLTACVAAGWPTDGYTDVEHPLQQRIRATIERITGRRPAAVAVDGCGTPVFAVTLTALALGFGSLAVAPAGSPDRAVADAMRAHPEMVAGTGELDTLLMRAVPGLVAKRGADGVHALALRDGTGVALKIADGGLRAHLPVLLGALAHLGVELDPAADLPGLQARYAATPTGGGRVVGSVDLAPDLARALSTGRYWADVDLPLATVN